MRPMLMMGAFLCIWKKGFPLLGANSPKAKHVKSSFAPIKVKLIHQLIADKSIDNSTRASVEGYSLN